MNPDALPTDSAPGEPARLDLDTWPHTFTPGEPGAPVLLTLHGTGGDEREITALAEAIAPAAAVLSPRGSVSEGGAKRWFRRLREGVFDVDDVIVRAGELAAFVVAARERYELGHRPLIAAGFSNGANIALATALLHPDAVSRVVAFSGMHPFGDRELSGSSAGVELLLLNGDHDPMAPAASVAQLEQFATARGASVTRHTRPGGHGIDRSEVDVARDWIAARR